jgi:hypothetical protein
MPSRKQRKRRQKELRHEYEFVVVDEDGQEVEVDPDELRAQREEKERERASQAARDGKKPAGRAATARDGRGRPIREIQPPSWRRVWKRAAFFGVFMLVALAFINKGHPTQAILLALIYGALFVPFLYLMDRVQYRQYLRRREQALNAPPRTGARAAKNANGSSKRATPERGAGGRRGLRRGSRG